MGLSHGFETIEDQVEHHLLELHPVAAHAREVGSELQAHRHVAQDRIASQEPRDLPDDRVEVERHELGLALLDQRAQAVDHGGGPLVVRHDITQDPAHALEIHDLGSDEALGRLRVAKDRRQRLAELVGQRGGELAQSGDPADVGQLLAEPLGLELPLLARQRIGEDLAEEVELLQQLG